MFYFLERELNLTKIQGMFHIFEKAIVRRAKGVQGTINFSVLEFAVIAQIFFRWLAGSGICCKYLCHVCGKRFFKSSSSYGFI